MSAALQPTPFQPDMPCPSLASSRAISPPGPNVRTLSDERPTPSKRTSTIASDGDSTRSPQSDPAESETGVGVGGMSSRNRLRRDGSGRYTGTRFVDHEDAGVAEVVEVPPRCESIWGEGTVDFLV